MTQDVANKESVDAGSNESKAQYVTPRITVLGKLSDLTGSGHGVTRDAQSTGNQRS